jgi:hypothetical protein
VIGRDRALLRSSGARLGVYLPIAIALLATGCRTVVGEPLPESLRAGVFCVELPPRDGRNLAAPIAESLRVAGLDTYVAAEGNCGEDSPYHVTYVDSWSWDMRTYLLRLTLEVVAASNGEIVAFGESGQDSLGSLGTSHRDVIDRAVASLLEVR